MKCEASWFRTSLPLHLFLLVQMTEFLLRVLPPQLASSFTSFWKLSDLLGWLRSPAHVLPQNAILISIEFLISNH